MTKPLVASGSGAALALGLCLAATDLSRHQRPVLEVTLANAAPASRQPRQRFIEACECSSSASRLWQLARASRLCRLWSGS